MNAPTQSRPRRASDTQAQPPGQRRPVADAFGRDERAHRSMAAQMKDDPSLLEKLKEAFRRIVAYFVNLIRAICGHAPLPQASDEQAIAPETAANFVGQEGKEGALGAERGEVKPFASPVAGFAPGGAAATFAGEAEGAAETPKTSHGQTSYGMAGDDPQRLFAAMTESLAKCVQACQAGEAPLEEGADASAYLRSMSARLQGAIAGLRTQQAMHLGAAMSMADGDFTPGSGMEAEVAEQWVTSGEVTPERAHALREIASAQMLHIMSQIARLGMKEQALEAEGLQDASLAQEIQQMLNDSSRTLVQASVFARAAGEDPSNLIREVQMKLEQQLQQDVARAEQKEAARAADRASASADDEGWNPQFRPA